MFAFAFLFPNYSPINLVHRENHFCTIGGSNLIFFSVYQTPPLEDQISHIVAPSVDYAPTTSKLLVEDQDAAAF